MKFCNKLLLYICLPILTVYSQNDIEGSKDHPLIPRFPGSAIVYFNNTENGKYEFTLGPLVKQSPDEDYKLTDTRIIEGNITRIQYKINETDFMKVVNYYEHSLKANGLEIAAITKAEKPMETAGRNWALVVFKDLPQKEKSNITGTKTGIDNRYYIAGHIHRLNRKAYFAMIINEFDKGEVYVQADIISSDNYPAKREILSAELIEQSINEDGYAVINSIYFESNSADIREESKPAFEEIAEYLKKNMGISLYVVGHTGMTGKFDYLMALSKNMADAVIKFLATRYNINPERLIPQGIGPLSPITTNQNIDGRNFNQRIELVLKNF